MGIGQSVKKGFSVAGSSLDLVGVLFTFGLVWNLINLALSSRVPVDADPDPATAAMMVVAGVVFLLLTIFFQAGSLGYVKVKEKAGAAGMNTFVEYGRRFYVSILAIAAIVTLIIVVFVLMAAFAANAMPENMQALAAVVAILFAALGLSFVVLLFLAPYVVIAEGAKAGEAIRASMGLVKKNIGALLGLSLILVLIGFGIGMVLGAVFAGLALVIKGAASQVVFAVLSSAVNAYLGVVVTGAFMAFYLSLPKGAAPNHN